VQGLHTVLGHARVWEAGSPSGSRPTSECRCLSAPAERKGCLSCQEVVGTDGLWLNKREVPIREGRPPQLELGADGSEADGRGTSQFTKCVIVSWWPSENQRGHLVHFLSSGIFRINLTDECPHSTDS